MATLDDKLMGEKLHYYCSSSEDEDEQEKPKFVSEAEAEEASRGQGGVSANTGPKGVIEDWRRYKQLEKENREEQEMEKLALAQKLSLTCRSEREDQEAKAREETTDQELEALLDDDVLAEFMQKRMREMMEKKTSTKRFGQLQDLNDADQFLAAVDQEEKDVVVIVFIFEHNVVGCDAMTSCLKLLAKDHPSVKFCRIQASTAGLSKHFKSDGVPALLVYRGGELISSFVRVTDVLGEDFYVSDVESFLVEHAILSDKELVPQIIRSSNQDDEDDSD